MHTPHPIAHHTLTAQPNHLHTHCNTTGVPLKKMEEASYFFRMSKFKQRLVAHIQNSPHFILPESRRNLILGASLRDCAACVCACVCV